MAPHLRRMLDLARWAPSGDNAQPWQFEVLGEEHLLIHGFDTREHVVYDLDGHASQLAHGALIENLAIAAAGEGRRAIVTRRLDTADTALRFDVTFEPAPGTTPDPLAAHIVKRAVQRRPMSTQALTPQQKQTLATALPPGYTVIWHEGWAGRWLMAKLCFDNAKIRLTIPEAFAVHRTIFEWHARYSEDKIPDQAIGADPLSLWFMRWALASWSRVQFLNTWLGGDLPPRLQLDLLPGLMCAAHFALLAPKALLTVDDYVSAGRAMQRFWLTAESLGLYVQPEMTPVIFSRFHREQRHFTINPTASALAGELNDRLAATLHGAHPDRLLFLGRIGRGPAPRARSTRKPVEALLVLPQPGAR